MFELFKQQDAVRMAISEIRTLKAIISKVIAKRNLGRELLDSSISHLT